MKQNWILGLLLFSLVWAVNLAVVPQAAGVGNTGTPVGCVSGTTLDTATGKCKIDNPAPAYLVDKDIKDFVVQVINVLLYFAGAIAVLLLIIGGFRYVTSAGNDESMEKAKKTITSAIIGLVIIIMAYAIVAVINNLVVNGVGP